MAYLDEAGISNPGQEPFTVVAGVVFNADQQWLAIDQKLSVMGDRYAPRDQRHDFVFHAAELFHGTKRFHRNNWTKEKRWAILDQLVAIPRDLELAIVSGFVKREEVASRYPDADTATITKNAQLCAFAICSYTIELWMRTRSTNEVGMVIMENNDQARRAIREFHHFGRDPRNADLLRSHKFGDLVLSKVVDTVHFAEKAHSSPLQLADICAFTIKRHLVQTPESDRFYLPLRPRMVILPKEELAEIGR